MSKTEDYGAVAITRAKELPTRLALALFLAGVATMLSGPLWPAVWYGCVCVAQAIDWLAFKPIRQDPDRAPSRVRIWLCVLSATFNTAVYSGIAVYLWFAGGEAGKLFAILQPAGGLLHIALHMHSAWRLFLAAAIPHLSYLLFLPLLSGVLSPRDDMLPMTAVTIAGVLYSTHLFVAVRRTMATNAALRQALDQADAERLRAEQASAAKSTFLATISHEIRTPMNAVVAAATLLQDDKLTPAQAEHVQMLSHSSEVLLGLLNDVLDLSKIESGKLVLEEVAIDLPAKLEASLHLWRGRAEAAGVTMSGDFADVPARIVTDPLRFQQILSNLLSNAVKFTEAGSIELHAGRLTWPARLWVEVRDTGVGMTPEVAARIFDRFEQANPGTSRSYGGTGLGLSISRHLAEAMGGSLTVRSEPGAGSVFRLELPLVFGDEGAISAEHDEEVADGCLRQVNVLLAEDHPVNQKIVQLYLEPLGCRVTVAENGEEAVKIAAVQAFDVILMDMQMPVMDGIEATRRIRETGANLDTPILALTANALLEHRQQWLRVGVETFLTKPLDARGLIEAVSTAAAEGDRRAA
ncbi:ATP-binding protein [Caulobacter segnis]|uniref:ATP-binding protein n=1 Tax=Caulobacter segnis TaxID=88688 RepID=UPI0024107742|nr:ATP-binding protein [Caulobacter segnis]MDG2523463.1 ATP-binding protein [Caulobacter segnis]